MTWVDARPDLVPSDAQVLAVENALRVDLPADYLAISPSRGRTRAPAPQPSDILLPGGFGTSVLGLLHLADDGPGISNILTCHGLLSGVLDKGVIPFALDVGHDVFCLNYRDDYDHPSVLFWGQGFGALPLAPSFTAFLDLLHDAHELDG